MRWTTAMIVTLGLIVGFPTLVHAQEDEEEIGFEDVEEPEEQGYNAWLEKIHISGRFDLNLEITDVGDGQYEKNFRSYHHFVFLKVTPNEKVTLTAEIVDLIFYEIGYKLGPSAGMRFGKIWVPFGNSPFHHFYGGVQGDPFTGLLVPNVWAELGAALDYEIVKSESGGMVLSGDTYVIRGFDGDPGTVLNLNEGGKDDVFALGQRITLNLNSRKVLVSGSGLYNAWGPDGDNKVFLWGGDLDLGYRLVDTPFLRDLAFRGAFARAEVKDPDLVESRFDEDGWYYKYGDFAELAYGGFRPDITLKLRYGSYIDFDDVVTNNDSHAFSVSVIHPHEFLTLMAQYFWIFEEVDEIDNDFFRLQLVLEF